MKQFSGKVLFLDINSISIEDIVSSDFIKENGLHEAKHGLFKNLQVKDFNPASDIPGKGVLIVKNSIGDGIINDYVIDALVQNGISIIVANLFEDDFKTQLNKKGIFSAQLDKKSQEDIFRVFADKDTVCSIKVNEDNTAKVKLISGSLSKSYQFVPDENEKKLLEI